MRSTDARAGSPTIASLVAGAAAEYGDRVALSTKGEDGWTEHSYAEVGGVIAEVALGLLDLGLSRGDRVGILCDTRPEWTYAGLAVVAAGGVVVPVYPSNSPSECAWVLGNSEAEILVCENASQLSKFAEVRDELPAITQVIVIDHEAGMEDVIAFDALRRRGAEREAELLEDAVDAVEPGDTCIVVYTSGTTGRPKGCVLSHRNLRAVLDSLAELGTVEPDDGTYLFLPLAHVFSFVLQLMSIDVGARMAYFGGDPSKIIEEIGDVGPTYFPSIPRIFEKIYAQVVPSAKEKLGDERFAELVATGTRYRELEYADNEVPDDLRADFDSADEQLFAKVRAIFGGRIRQAATGAAPIDHEVLEFFYAAGIPVLEGYGMTEAATAITVGTPEHLKWGTVGRALPGVELQIADDGEILVRAENVFEGYYKDEAATAEAIVDGWLHTGDLGELDDDGYLTITGRKKDIIITSSGKNLTPSNLENDMKATRYVSQAVMHGDRRPFPSMLITLDAEEIGAWARENDKSEDLADLAEDADVIALIQAALDEANRAYARAEQVKKFFILDRDLSHEDGELTPTMKVKRAVVNERYEQRFDALYDT